MIFPKLSEGFSKFTASFAGLGQRLQNLAGSGFIGGIVFGAALGLLWTPCAGPILAAITTLVATQSVGGAVIALTLAYSIGAAIPLSLIAYGGGKIIQSSKFLSRHSEGLRRVFGVVMIVTAAGIAFHWDMKVQQAVIRFFPSILIENNAIVKTRLQKISGENLSELGKAPELVGIVNWINSPPLSLMDLRGKVVLIDFWTYSCINCIRTLPYVEKWYEDYKDQGLVIIGVHTPEFEFEKDPGNVAKAVARLGITYPVAQDNDYKTWQAYRNHYWPADFLIDQEGNIRLMHYGEGDYVETENAIRSLLGMEATQKKEPSAASIPLSSETYLGLARGKSFTSENRLAANQTAVYSYNGPLGDDQIGLKGKWKVEQEKITAEGDDCYLDMNFLASKVHLVLSGSSRTPMQVFVDGKPSSPILIDSDREYDVAQTSYGRHQLSLKIPKGISAYAFTFGGN
jgi:thiol-disulfide isomerase/thioredoxin